LHNEFPVNETKFETTTQILAWYISWQGGKQLKIPKRAKYYCFIFCLREQRYCGRCKVFFA